MIELKENRLTMKLTWTRADIGRLLRYAGADDTVVNIKRTMEELEKLSDVLDSKDDVENFIEEFAKNELQKKKNCMDINEFVHLDEKIISFTLSDMIGTYHFIASKDDNIEYMDIAGAIEDTFHRLKEAGATNTDLFHTLGAIRDEPYDENQIAIDLGYSLSGLITSFHEESL